MSTITVEVPEGTTPERFLKNLNQAVHFKDFQEEYRNKPENKTRAKALAKVYSALPEIKARNNRPGNKARKQAHGKKRIADIAAGRRVPNHHPITPNKAFDELLETLPKEVLQHQAGFLEGDGSVGSQKNKLPQMSFANLDKPLIQYIKDTLQLSRKIIRGNYDCYSINIGRQELIQSLLRALSPYFCCPKFIKRVQKTFSECGYDIDFELSEHEPTIPWFVGFAFDAEGTKIDPRNAQLRTSQKDTRPLEKLQKLFNSGTIEEFTDKETGRVGHRIVWSGGNFRKLTPYILKYSKNQSRRDRLESSLYFLAKESPNSVWAKFYQQLKKDDLL